MKHPLGEFKLGGERGLSAPVVTWELNFSNID
jgi:hypothetical protein